MGGRRATCSPKCETFLSANENGERPRYSTKLRGHDALDRAVHDRRIVPERAAITLNASAPDFDSISQRIFGAKKFRGNLAGMERQGYHS